MLSFWNRATFTCTGRRRRTTKRSSMTVIPSSWAKLSCSVWRISLSWVVKKLATDHFSFSSFCALFLSQGTSYSVMFITMPDLVQVYDTSVGTLSLTYVAETSGRITTAVLLGSKFDMWMGLFFRITVQTIQPSRWMAEDGQPSCTLLCCFNSPRFDHMCLPCHGTGGASFCLGVPGRHLFSSHWNR